MAAELATEESLSRNLALGAWVGCAAVVVASALVLAISRTSVDARMLAWVGVLLAIPGAIYLVYARLRRDPIIAAVGGAMTIIGVCSFAAAILGLAALRLGAPLVDAALARADEAMGLTSPDLLAWLARHKAFGAVLGQVYLSAGVLIFLVIPLLGLTRQTWRLWELSFTFAATVLPTTLISVFFPAIGAIVYYKISPDILAQLPPGAGRLYVPTFEAFHSGVLQTIDFDHLEGVVTFPSYHAIMALLVAHAWRGLPGATLVKLWAALVMVSAIPLGGHYVIDLIVGAALWWTVAMVANRLRGLAATRPVDWAFRRSRLSPPGFAAGADGAAQG